MYEVLVYLFENCQQREVAYESDRVAKKLSAAGFEHADISEALHWLAGMARTPQEPVTLPDPSRSFRAFAPRELAKLDAHCRGFLLTLEQSGILTPQNRELVLERSLAASGASLTLEQVKLIVLMVLWNQQTPTSQLLAEEIFTGGEARLPN